MSAEKDVCDAFFDGLKGKVSVCGNIERSKARVRCGGDVERHSRWLEEFDAEMRHTTLYSELSAVVQPPEIFRCSMFAFTSSFDRAAASRCPADFDRQEYARGVHKERLRAAVTVTAAAFSPCGGYVVCASDSGRLAVWELAPYMNRAAFSPGESRDTTPHLSFRADRSCINCVTFADEFLLCGGDESLFGWPWSDILAALRQRSPPPGAIDDDDEDHQGGDAEKISPSLRVRCPQERTRRGGFMPYPEINDVVFDKNTGRVLCAAGDGNAYEWDMRSLGSTTATTVPMPGGAVGAIDETQTPVQTYRRHRGYLLAVASARGSSIVATGSEDGYVGIWDRRVKTDAGGANAAFFRPAHIKAGDKNGASPQEGVGSDGEAWVSSLEMDDGGHTLVCAGGRSGVGWGDQMKSGGGRGWVNQWNLGALTAMSVASIPAEVQCMTRTDEGQMLLVGGAEGYITSLSRSRLETRSRTPVCSSSVYALAFSPAGPHEGMTCIAGVGPAVSICTLPGIVSFTLCFM